MRRLRSPWRTLIATIRLSEYTPSLVDLLPDDAEYIDQTLKKRVDIWRDVGEEMHRLNPNQWVGVVVLPSGRRLESYPKVPVRNLFYMLAVAYKIDPFLVETAAMDRLDELFEFVARYFTDLVEQRLERGLYRSYVEIDENLPTVRGRIAFAEDIRRNYVLRHRTYCRYSDFTWDIPENQVIRQVAHLLSGWGFRRDLRLRLARIDAVMAEVTPTHMPGSAIASFRYNRQNDEYRPLHQLCRLFLEGASLSEDEGAFDFRTFLVDMNKLFEQFITQVLVDRAHGSAVVAPQASLYLGHDKKVFMRPDILISAGGAVTLAADCKYKRIKEEEYKNHDIYQVHAYCTAASVRKGLLIYPQHVSNVNDEVRVRYAEVSIRQKSIDLGKSHRELVGECDSLARFVFNWAAEAASS